MLLFVEAGATTKMKVPKWSQIECHMWHWTSLQNWWCEKNTTRPINTKTVLARAKIARVRDSRNTLNTGVRKERHVETGDHLGDLRSLAPPPHSRISTNRAIRVLAQRQDVPKNFESCQNSFLVSVSTNYYILYRFRSCHHKQQYYHHRSSQGSFSHFSHRLPSEKTTCIQYCSLTNDWTFELLETPHERRHHFSARIQSLIPPAASLTQQA